MPIPNPKKTKKKFYNKFIYKVTLDAPGSRALRWYSISQLATLDLSAASKRTYSWQEEIVKTVSNNSKFWLDLTGIVLGFKKELWRKRLEGENLDIYTNDSDLYNKLCNTFPDRIVLRYAPKKGTEQLLLDNDKEILCNEIPHGKYNYRVYLYPHKIDSQTKVKVCDWFKRQGDKTSFSKSIEKWLLNTKENWDRRYVLIDNESTILMLRLLSSEVIGQTHKYVKHDK